MDRARAGAEWVTFASGESGTDAILLAQDATSLDGAPLSEGDGVAVSGESAVTFGGGDAELLAFDLA